MKNWFVLFALLISPILAQAEFINPIQDRAVLFSIEEREALSGRLEALHDSRKVWVVVETIRNTGAESLESLANREFTRMKIGTRADNGILILIASDDKKVRIEVGRGLESRITDLKTREIIDLQMIPQLKAAHPFQAVLDAALAIDDLSVGFTPEEIRPKNAVASTYLILAAILVVGLIWIPLGISPAREELQNYRAVSHASPALFEPKYQKIHRSMNLSVLAVTIGWALLFWIYSEFAQGTPFRIDDSEAFERPFLFGALFVALEFVLLSVCISSAKSTMLEWLYLHSPKDRHAALRKFANRTGRTSSRPATVSLNLYGLDASDSTSYDHHDSTSFGYGGNSDGGGSSGSF